MIQQKIRGCIDANGAASLMTLEFFVGMLESGEATLEDFVECGVNLEQLARAYGSANCWTGTSGTLAAKLIRFTKCK